MFSEKEGSRMKNKKNIFEGFESRMKNKGKVLEKQEIPRCQTRKNRKFEKCIIADFIKHMNFFDLGKIAKDKNMI